MDPQHYCRVCDNFADDKPFHPLEHQTVEFLIGLLIFGILIYLLPYIIGGAVILIMLIGLFIGAVVVFTQDILKLRR